MKAKEIFPDPKRIRRKVVAAVIRDGKGRTLIVQRPACGLLGSLWKFPGGILNPQEAREEGLKRIVRDELGIGIGVGSPFAAVKHAYTHFRITLTAFSCTLLEGSPAGPQWRWAGAGESEALPFSSADRRIARSVSPPTGHLPSAVSCYTTVVGRLVSLRGETWPRNGYRSPPPSSS